MTKKAEICWMCGQTFGTGKNAKTSHHVIQQRHKPKVNITIPLHRHCHDVVDNIKQPEETKKLKDVKRSLDRIHGIVQALEGRLKE